MRLSDGRTLAEYIADLRWRRELITAGVAPSVEELMGAPTIADWMVEFTSDSFAGSFDQSGYLRIVGVFNKHPYIRSGARAYSSPVLQIDPDYRWARCQSRTYVLLEPIRPRVLAQLSTMH